MNLIIVTEEDVANEEFAWEVGENVNVRLEQKDDMFKYVLPKDDPRTTHIRRMLKSETGDILRLGILNQAKGTAILKWLENGSAELTPRDDFLVPSKPVISLLLACPRPKVLNRIWPMISSQGVLDVTVIGAEKVEKGFFSSSKLEPENIRNRCLSGLVQGQDV